MFQNLEEITRLKIVRLMVPFDSGTHNQLEKIFLENNRGIELLIALSFLSPYTFWKFLLVELEIQENRMSHVHLGHTFMAERRGRKDYVMGASRRYLSYLWILFFRGQDLWYCSGLISGPVLRNNSWWTQVDIWHTRDQTIVGYVQCKHISTVLLLQL